MTAKPKILLLSAVPGFPASVADLLADDGVATVQGLVDRTVRKFPGLLPPTAAVYGAIRTVPATGPAGSADVDAIGRAAAALVAHLGLPDHLPPIAWGKPPAKPAAEPAAPGPIVCRPLGECRLADVHQFPPAAAAHLEGRGVRTLADLEVHARNSNIDPAPGADVRYALGSLDVPAELVDDAVRAVVSHFRPSIVPPPKKPRAKKPAPPPEPAAPRSDPLAALLADVPGFPATVAAELAGRGVRVVGDLRPHAGELRGKGQDARAALVAMGVAMPVLDQCSWSLNMHLGPAGLAGAAPTSAPAGAADEADGAAGGLRGGPVEAAAAGADDGVAARCDAGAAASEEAGRQHPAHGERGAAGRGSDGDAGPGRGEVRRPRPDEVAVERVPGPESPPAEGPAAGRVVGGGRTARNSHRALSDVIDGRVGLMASVCDWRETGATDGDVAAALSASFGVGLQSHQDLESGHSWRVGPAPSWEYADGDGSHRLDVLEMVQVVRDLFAIPTPEEVQLGDDRASEPVRLSGVPGADAHHQHEQRDDAVRDQMPAVSVPGVVLGDVLPGNAAGSHENQGGRGAGVLPATARGVRSPRPRAATVRPRRGDAEQATGPGVAPTGDGAAVPGLGDAGGVHAADVRCDAAAMIADDFGPDAPPLRRDVTPAAKDGLPRWVKLRPQDAPLAEFWSWCRAGRVPVGSVLVHRVYPLAGGPEVEGQTGRRLAGMDPAAMRWGRDAVGRWLTAADLEGLEQRASVEHGRLTYYVWSPRRAGA